MTKPKEIAEQLNSIFMELEAVTGASDHGLSSKIDVLADATLQEWFESGVDDGTKILTAIKMAIAILEKFNLHIETENKFRNVPEGACADDNETKH